MINKPKGTQDLLPSVTAKIQHIEDAFKKTAGAFGFQEIRTPVFEHTELFSRSAGEGSDIVNKEMYTFTDKGGRSLTLKPEGTAGVARAFIENGLGNTQLPMKLWYNTPVFRYERPQAGRYREHHQLGCELFGSALPEADFEVIAFADTFLKSLGVHVSLFVNSIGGTDCRGKYLDALKSYYELRADKLCGQCNTRLQKNTLRILDCKEEGCGRINAGAPVITDYLCRHCAEHFEKLKKLLKAADINFAVDSRIVRGLDYYSGTVFEFVTEAIGAKSTVCGGGRYDNLIEELGGKSVPAAGFGLGIERLLLLMENSGISINPKTPLKVYFAVTDCESRELSLSFLKKLRAAGITAETDLADRSLKAQLKYASGQNADYAVIIGGDEIKTQTALVKNMKTELQESVGFNNLTKYLEGQK